MNAKNINFAVATALQVETAFKFAGLDEMPRYKHIISSHEMCKALMEQGYTAIQDKNGFIKAVK